VEPLIVEWCRIRVVRCRAWTGEVLNKHKRLFDWERWREGDEIPAGVETIEDGAIKVVNDATREPGYRRALVDDGKAQM
jgi:hypothetical protein